MDGAAGSISLELRQVQCFLHDSLTDEGGIAVDQNRHNREIIVMELILLGAHDAFEDAVSGLQVRRVCSQIHLGGHTVFTAEHAFSAQVVLHVAGAFVLRVFVAFKLREDLPVGLAGNVGQYVQPAAVSHADSHLR